MSFSVASCRVCNTFNWYCSLVAVKLFAELCILYRPQSFIDLKRSLIGWLVSFLHIALTYNFKLL